HVRLSQQQPPLLQLCHNSVRSPEADHQHYAPAKSLFLHEYVLIKHQSRREYPVDPIAQCWLWTVLKGLRVTHQFPESQRPVPHSPELATRCRNDDKTVG